MRAYPDINYRYFIRPEKPMEGNLALLDFRWVTTEKLFDKGISDAKTAIDMGPGKSF